MSFIYYVLMWMLTYTGPVYAEIGVAPNEEHEVYAQVEDDEISVEKVKIFLDKSHTTTAIVDKQDCSIMRKKDDSLALGFKFGGLMWGFGPEIKIGHSSGVEWKSDVQRMVAEYQELCTQFNTGRLSQQEYQAEKQQIVQRGYNYARELEKRFKQKKDDIFKEMDGGRYIHLQNSRFYEGCCLYNELPVSTKHEEEIRIAERERELREREQQLLDQQRIQQEERERRIAERERELLRERERRIAKRESELVRERQVVAQRQVRQHRHVRQNYVFDPNPPRRQASCWEIGVCNRARSGTAHYPLSNFGKKRNSKFWHETQIWMNIDFNKRW
jgi:hypothetical protein